MKKIVKVISNPLHYSRRLGQMALFRLSSILGSEIDETHTLCFPCIFVVFSMANKKDGFVSSLWMPFA